MFVRTGFVLSLLVALLLTGCGGADGGEDGGVATGGGTATASAAAGAGDKKAAGLKYAQCMRDNGVKEFPDPEVDGNGQLTFDMPEDIPDSVMNAAEEKCRDLRPFGPGAAGPDPQRIEQLRKLAQCIRENGVPNFPDPQDDGSSRYDPERIGLSGADDPRLKAAREKCRHLQPSPPPGAKLGNG
jgi:hypothetical protein